MTNGNANPRPPVELTGLSDVGRRRGSNEDAFATLAEAGLALLADGMGGHARGELASALAVSTSLRHLIDSAADRGGDRIPAATRLADAVAAANRAVLAGAAREPGAEGMGTTLLVTLFESGWLHVAHVGDARLYRLRGGTLERLTTDQTVGELLATRTGRHDKMPFANVLTQALGCEEEVMPELLQLVCEPGDLYLLCSDGLHGMLDEELIRLTLQKFDANLGAIARELIALANARGGFDNITVVLARPEIPKEEDH